MYSVKTRVFGMKGTFGTSLSVIVPIGPMAGKLENLLSWIDIIQDYSAQVILVVDEKNDGTYDELILALERKKIVGSVLVLNAVCNGPGNARNLGTCEATGTWIAYWDSDDNPNVKQVFRAIQESKEDVDAIVCRYEEIHSNGRITAPILSNLQIGLSPGIWRFIFRRESFAELEFPNLRLAEDQVFLIRSRVFSKNLKFHNVVSYQYIHGGANQLTKEKSNLPDLLKALDLLSDLNSTGTITAPKEKNFLYVMILRLCLTSLKNNTAKTLPYFMKNPSVLMISLKAIQIMIFARSKE